MTITIDISPEGEIKLFCPFVLSEDLVVKILQHCINLIEEKEEDTKH